MPVPADHTVTRELGWGGRTRRSKASAEMRPGGGITKVTSGVCGVDQMHERSLIRRACEVWSTTSVALVRLGARIRWAG